MTDNARQIWAFPVDCPYDASLTDYINQFISDTSMEFAKNDCFGPLLDPANPNELLVRFLNLRAEVVEAHRENAEALARLSHLQHIAAECMVLRSIVDSDQQGVIDELSFGSTTPTTHRMGSSKLQKQRELLNRTVQEYILVKKYNRFYEKLAVMQEAQCGSDVNTPLIFDLIDTFFSEMTDPQFSYEDLVAASADCLVYKIKKGIDKEKSLEKGHNENNSPNSELYACIERALLVLERSETHNGSPCR